MKRFFYVMILTMSLNVFASPVPVENFEVKRYLGKWYEIARFTLFFEKNCFCSTAEYGLQKDGKISVHNECREGGPNGDLNKIDGVASVPNPARPSQLKVQFFPLIKSDYWIIELDPKYRFAAVSNSDGSTLWILSRTPEMDPVAFDKLLQVLETKHKIDVAFLELGIQDFCHY